LPSDFRAFTIQANQNDWEFGRAVSLAEIMHLDRYESSTGTAIQYYCIAEAPDLYDQLALFIWPQLTKQKTIDFVYIRNPRPLRYSGYTAASDYAGTVDVTANSAAVTGTDTAFADEMEGAIFRIGSHSSEAPTGLFGDQPYVEERAISTYASATSITLDGNVVTTRSGVKYRITDPIDIGRVAKNAFLRCCEKNLVRTCFQQSERQENLLSRAKAEYQEALIWAMGADNRRYYDPSQGSGALRLGRGYEPLDRTDW